MLYILEMAESVCLSTATVNDGLIIQFEPPGNYSIMLFYFILLSIMWRKNTMEIAAAAGSAATIVQLVDFAGTLLKATVTFLRAVNEASKDIDALHIKISQLQGLFEQIRHIAKSYQDSSLADSPANKQSFDLLSVALTHCAQDLQIIKSSVQKPIDKSTKAMKKWSRSAKHVFDEERLKRTILRLDGHIIYLTAILSCISMYDDQDLIRLADSDRSNDTETHKAVQSVRQLVETVQSDGSQISHLITIDKTRLLNLENQTNEIARWMQQFLSPAACQARSTILLERSNSYQQMVASTLAPVMLQPPALENLPPNAFTDPSSIFEALHLLTPAIAKVSVKLRDSALSPTAKKPIEWILSEMHLLLASIHTETSKYYASSDHSHKTTPKRFQRQTRLNIHGANIGQIVEYFDFAFDKISQMIRSDYVQQKPRRQFYIHRVVDFHAQNRQAVGVEDLATVFLFSCPVVPNVLAVSIEMALRRKGSLVVMESRLSFCSVHSYRGPVVDAVRAGDHGLGSLVRFLKSGQVYAGDIDNGGTSLLSHAAAANSRDMCALLLKMGADARDIRENPKVDLPVITQWREDNATKSWANLNEKIVKFEKILSEVEGPAF
jgi:hypothetical protein